MKTSTKILSLFILFSLMMSIVKNNTLYLVYKYDNQLFENLFCKNIDLPELECHGQCMLADMQDTQNNDDPKNSLLKQFQIEIFYYKTSIDFDIPKKTFVLIGNNLFIPFQNLYKFLYSRENIKPPKSFIV